MRPGWPAYRAGFHMREELCVFIIIININHSTNHFSNVRNKERTYDVTTNLFKHLTFIPTLARLRCLNEEKPNRLAEISPREVRSR